MTVTLRIKRQFFDLILAGRKHVEYRDAKPYYDRMFANKAIDSLVLHYQRPDRKLRVEVKGIVRMRSPQWLREEGESEGIAISEFVYAIRLGDAALI